MWAEVPLGAELEPIGQEVVIQKEAVLNMKAVMWAMLSYARTEIGWTEFIWGQDAEVSYNNSKSPQKIYIWNLWSTIKFQRWITQNSWSAHFTVRMENGQIKTWWTIEFSYRDVIPYSVVLNPSDSVRWVWIAFAQFMAKVNASDLKNTPKVEYSNTNHDISTMEWKINFFKYYGYSISQSSGRTVKMTKHTEPSVTILLRNDWWTDAKMYVWWSEVVFANIVAAFSRAWFHKEYPYFQ